MLKNVTVLKSVSPKLKISVASGSKRKKIIHTYFNKTFVDSKHSYNEIFKMTERILLMVLS